jgi:hypothetical protein
MHDFKKILFISLIIILWGSRVFSQTLGLKGQLSGWVTINPEPSFETQIGLRYIPGLSIEKTIYEKYLIDTDISVNTYGYSLIHSSDDIDTDGKIKPYRIWLRLSSSQYELRIGLQKINFGSAMLLRPLMWFDRIDPRDPLQLTDGVYALLGRYYFLNNTNIWLWGLYGNDDAKGWEVFPSYKKEVEYGGRLQVPLYNGEIALSYHHRQANLSDKQVDPNSSSLSTKNKIPEDRFGLDGKWDIGIGLWFEGALIHQNFDISVLKYQRLINVGLDYTFELGNGLHVVGEYFTRRTSEKAFGYGEDISFSAVSLNYHLGVIDTLTGMVYYGGENHDWYRFINWQRMYDNWSLHFIGFWNPDQLQVYQNLDESFLFAGKGIQVMVVFNH